MKRMLHDAMRPGDATAIVTFHYAMKVEQEFTGDLPKLDAALDRLHAFFDRVSEDPQSEILRNESMQELLDEDSRAAGSQPVPSLYDELSKQYGVMRIKLDNVTVPSRSNQ